MKWSTLSARERRTVWIGGAIVVVSLGFLYGVRPYRAALEDARDQLAAERATLARERAAVASASRTRSYTRSPIRRCGPCGRGCSRARTM